jgi:hypothetical protein
MNNEERESLVVRHLERAYRAASKARFRNYQRCVGSDHEIREAIRKAISLLNHRHAR